MKNRIYIKRIVLIILIILWLSFIFGMSAETGEESSGLSIKMARILYRISIVPEIIKFNTLHTIVRKTAHFTEYGILAILAFAFFNTFVRWKNFLKERCIIKAFAPSVLLCFLVAASDEFHQSFVPGRGPSIIDVGIDCCGAVFWLVIYVLVAKLLVICQTSVRKSSSQGKV